MKIRRMISILLVICLMFALASINAFAYNDKKTQKLTSKDGVWVYYRYDGDRLAINPWNGMWQAYPYTDFIISEYHGTEKTLTLPLEIDGNPINGVMNFIGTATHITIPVTYNCFHNCAFADCKGLKTVTFSQEYTEPLLQFPAVFADCKTLTKVVLPNVMDEAHAVDSILPVSLFENCPKLTEVVIPEQLKLKKIDNTCFKGCKSLKTFTIPKGVEYIGEGCFDYCTSLEEIIVSEGTTNIVFGGNSIDGCKNLKELSLPQSLEKLDVNYNALKEVTVYVSSVSQICKEIQKKVKNVIVENYKIKNIYDINQDNCSNILDVTILQKYLAHSLLDEALSKIDISIADFDKNGETNINDVTYLQKILALKIIE